MRKKTLFAICCLVIGCKEGPENKKYTEVRVYASNYLTNAPINDIHCSVYSQGDFGNSNLMSQSMTEGGEYEFNFLAEKNKSYSLSSSFDVDKYDAISYLQFATIDKYSLNEFHFKFVESAYLNTNFININCEDTEDLLHYRYYYLIDNIFTYNAYWTSLSLNGCINIVGEAYQKLPAGYYVFEWNVQRTSGYDSGVDTFFIGNNDSLTYLLEY